MQTFSHATHEIFASKYNSNKKWAGRSGMAGKRRLAQKFANEASRLKIRTFLVY